MRVDIYYRTARGGCAAVCVHRLSADECSDVVATELKKLHRRGVYAEAWEMAPDGGRLRDYPFGEVTDTPDGERIWWCE